VSQTYPEHQWAWYVFKLYPASRTVRCSECGRKIQRGELSYEHRKGGKVMKRVCSEECGQKFDYVMMSEQARRRELGISRKEEVGWPPSGWRG